MDLVAALTNPAAQAFGQVMTVVGVIVSVGGFGIALRQLQKTKRAAEAASSAVESFRVRLAQIDTVGELRSAEAMAGETIRHIETSAWPYAMDGYRRLRSSLVRVTAESLMQEQDLTTLRNAIPDVASTISSLQAWRTHPPNYRRVKLMTQQLEKCIDAITSAVVRLQGKAP